MRGRELEEEAARWLEHAGYIVQREVELGARTGSRSGLRADIVAWQAGLEGLVPALLVEVKPRSGRTNPLDSLGQVLAYQNLAHATRAFVFDGAWWTPNASGTALERADPPTASGDPGPSAGSDAVLGRAVASEIWAALDEGRRKSGPISVELLSHVLESLITTKESLTSRVAGEPRSAELVFKAIQGIIPKLPSLGGQFDTADPLNRSVAALARARHGMVFDPFCGMGGTLLAVHQEVAKAGAGPLELVGRDRLPEIAKLASFFFDQAKVRARITVGDTFEELEGGIADVVVSDPPLNQRLARPVSLASGDLSVDGTVIAIDRSVRALKAGGRAVVVTVPSFLWRQGGAQQFREWLAATHRVTAILKFPAGTAANTAVPPVILVIEKLPPSQTLFATLGDDWQKQLAADGELLQAYLRHVGQP